MSQLSSQNKNQLKPKIKFWALKLLESEKKIKQDKPMLKLSMIDMINLTMLDLRRKKYL